MQANLDGSVKASHGLAAEATRVLGGRIDVLVNNAGIFPPNTTPDTNEALLDRVYAVNVKAPFLLTGVIAPQMAARGQGAIINLGSWLARLGIPGATAYNDTKDATETLTRDWAAEFGPAGVRVNAIAPGVIQNPTFGGAPEGAHFAMNGTLVGTSGPPEAIAHAAVYLASDEARWVTAQVLVIDAGVTLTVRGGTG